MMRIAIVAQPFDLVPPTKGGSLSIWAEELAKELSHKHKVSIYSRRAAGQPNVEVIDDVRHIRTLTTRDEKILGRFQRVERILNRLLKKQTYFFYTHYYFAARYYRHYIKAISKEIAANGEDVIVVSNFSQFVFPLRAQNAHSKIVLVMHCDWLKELRPEVVDKRLGKIDAVLGVSNYITEGIARQYPEHAAKCQTLHNGSNVDRFSTVPFDSHRTKDLKDTLGLGEKTVVTFVGRMAAEKGVHVLVEAMKRIAAIRQDIVLLVIGGISVQPPSPLWLRFRDKKFQQIELLKHVYKQHLSTLSKDHADCIRFLGPVSHYELPDYYGLTDIFVHPSVWDEPFGMILTEAMASRCPVISTQVGGIPEIVVHGETGLLVEANNPEALAAAIIDLVDNREKRILMGSHGQQRCSEKFTWSASAETFNKVLESFWI